MSGQNDEANTGHESADTQNAETASADPMEELRQERDKLKDQLLRTAADFENHRKRSTKEIEDSRKRGLEEAIRELLPVFDNLERAVQMGENASDATAVLDGIRMVLRLFEDHSGRLGVSRVEAMGQRFDPAVHDAIQQQETDEHPPGTVIAEVQPGYKLGERLVRPAMVVVARKPAASA